MLKGRGHNVGGRLQHQPNVHQSKDYDVIIEADGNIRCVVLTQGQYVCGKEKDPAHITKKMFDALTKAVSKFVWFIPTQTNQEIDQPFKEKQTAARAKRRVAHGLM